MARLFRTLGWTGALWFSLGSTAFAQGAITLAVQNFDVSGAGCPAKSATTVMLTTDMSGRQAARIAFSAPNAMAAAPQTPASPAPAAGMTPTTPASFQVSGATAQSACTVAITFGVSGAPTVDFAVARAVAGVSFANAADQGQLSLTSSFRVNNARSAARTSRISSSAPATGAAAQMSEITLNNINVSAEAQGQATVLANLQLQTMNAAADANLRLDSMLLVFNVVADIGG